MVTARFPALQRRAAVQGGPDAGVQRQAVPRVLGDKPLSKVSAGGSALLHAAAFRHLHAELAVMARASPAPNFVLDEAPSIYFDSCMMSYEAANAGMGFAVANRAYMTADIRAGQLVAPFRRPPSEHRRMVFRLPQENRRQPPHHGVQGMADDRGCAHAGAAERGNPIARRSGAPPQPPGRPATSQPGGLYFPVACPTLLAWRNRARS